MRKESTNFPTDNSLKRIFGKDITNQVKIAEKCPRTISSNFLQKESDVVQKENNGANQRPIRVNRGKNQSMDENLLKKVHLCDKNNNLNLPSQNLNFKLNIPNFAKNENIFPSANLISSLNDQSQTNFLNFNKNVNGHPKLNVSDIHMQTVSDEKVDSKFSFNSDLDKRKLILSPETRNELPHLDYIEEIYENLINEESSYFQKLSFKQLEINERMRTIVVKWIYEVVIKFKLRQDTFFLSIYILDKYLDQKNIRKSYLQLLGVSCLLIACKYEEIYFPEIRDLVYISDHSYSEKEILKMEYEVLSTLDFQIVPIFPMRFLQILAMKLKFEDTEIKFCGLMLELFTFDFLSNNFSPSTTACACAFIIYRIKSEFTQEIMQIILEFSRGEDKFTSEGQIKECAKQICVLLDNIKFPVFNVFREKYNMKEFEKLKIFFN